MKQSAAQCDAGSYSPSLTTGNEELTMERRLTKFGQVNAAILPIGASMGLTANLGSPLIDGAKETQCTPQPRRKIPAAGW
jgi:hypothetical protein